MYRYLSIWVPHTRVRTMSECIYYWFMITWQSAKQQCRMPPLVKGFLLMITWVSSLLGCMDNVRQHTWDPWKHSWKKCRSKALGMKIASGAAIIFFGEVSYSQGLVLEKYVFINPLPSECQPLWHLTPLLPSVFHRTHRRFDWPHQEGTKPHLLTISQQLPTCSLLPTRAQPWSLVFPGLQHPNQKWRSLIQKSWASPHAPGLATWIQKSFVLYTKVLKGVKSSYCSSKGWESHGKPREISTKTMSLRNFQPNSEANGRHDSFPKGKRWFWHVCWRPVKTDLTRAKWPSHVQCPAFFFFFFFSPFSGLWSPSSTLQRCTGEANCI